MAQQEPDSLYRILPQKKGAERIEILLCLSGYYATVSAKERDSLLHEAKRLLENVDYPIGQVRYWVIKAARESRQGLLDQADSTLQLAEDLALKIDSKESLADIFLTRGNLNQRRGKLALAVENHIEGIKAAQEANYVDMEVTNLLNLGLIKQRLGELGLAEQYLKEGLEKALDAGLDFRIAQLYLNLAVVSYFLYDLETSIEYNQEALDGFIRLGDRLNAAICYANLGFAYNLKKDRKQAKDFYNRALEIHYEFQNKEGIARTKINLANVFYEEQRFSQALEITTGVVQLQDSIGNLSLLVQAYNLRVNVFEALNLPGKALNAYKELSRVKDTISVRSNKSKIAELTADFELERKEKTIRIKEQELSILSGQKALLQSRQILLLVIVLLLTVLVMLMRARNKTKLQTARAKEQLAREEARIRKLESEKLSVELAAKKDQLKSYLIDLGKQNELVNTFKTRIRELERQGAKQEGLDHLINSLERSDINSLSWQEFRLKFEEVFPLFSSSLVTLCSTLTPKEIDVCLLLKINLSNPEIGQVLNISYDGVKKSVLRIYKKIGLSSTEELRAKILQLKA